MIHKPRSLKIVDANNRYVNVEYGYVHGGLTLFTGETKRTWTDENGHLCPCHTQVNLDLEQLRSLIKWLELELFSAEVTITEKAARLVG